MRRWLIKLLALAVVLSIAGFLVAASGLVPIAASSGHWAITSWFLHFTMQQSAQLQALGISAPPLDDPALVLRGASHYESGCAPCHGTASDTRSVVARQMTPPPPYLLPKISQWQPRELFWIVKHGIKFTAMPAWPAQQRDDEVWALVAFLLRLPELTVEQYRQLALGERADAAPGAGIGGGNRLRSIADPLADNIDICARCHGQDGAGRGYGAFPKLFLQTEEYLYGALRAYASGERHSGIMQTVAAGLTEESMRELARYYASRPPPGQPAPTPDSTGGPARGEEIAERGVPAQGVPACIACHGPKATPRSPFYPQLAGQYSGYLSLQLELLKNGRRGGTPYVHVMQTIADRLTAEQIQDVAAFYGSLPPEPSPGPINNDAAGDGGDQTADAGGREMGAFGPAVGFGGEPGEQQEAGGFDHQDPAE